MAIRFGSDVLPHARRPVAWYSPPVLLQAARELLSSQDFQRNLDRRENFAGAFEPIDLRDAFGAGPVGFDFLADTGDGGNATYTVADAATADALLVGDGRRFARPPFVVLGGDLAYPAASHFDYQYRFLEPFSIASPKDGEGNDRAWQHVLAIPQNHDWFDSVTTFCRYFVGRDGRRDFVGANAAQQRTYFAACLPQRWWILGLDFALRGDIDRNQFEALRSLWDPARPGPRVEAGDRVILVYPKPYWTEPLGFETPGGYTRRFQRLEHLLEAARDDTPDRDADSAGAGAQIVLRLAGDLHHYARRTMTGGDGRVRSALVTCGCAGAFLHTTHGREITGPVVLDRRPEPNTVPPSLGRHTRVGLPATPPPADDPRVQAFGPVTTWPDAAASKALATKRLWWAMLNPRLRGPGGLLGQLWNSNLGFAALLGLLYVANANVNAVLVNRELALDRLPPFHDPSHALWPELALRWLQAMFSSPLAALFNAGMIAGCVRLGWEGTWGRGAKLASGALHGMAHGFLVFTLYLVFARLALNAGFAPEHPAIARFFMWCGVGGAGALAGALLFGAVFWLLNVAGGQLTNNASGAMASEDWKGFLRAEIDARGLTLRLLGCERVPRRWRQHDAATPPYPVDVQPAWQVADEFRIETGDVPVRQPSPRVPADA